MNTKAPHMRPMTIKRIRHAASMLLFSSAGNRDCQRGVRAMRDLLIAGVRISRRSAKRTRP